MNIKTKLVKSMSSLTKSFQVEDKLIERWGWRTHLLPVDLFCCVYLHKF